MDVHTTALNAPTVDQTFSLNSDITTQHNFEERTFIMF